jgi:hypothetical protein
LFGRVFELGLLRSAQKRNKKCKKHRGTGKENKTRAGKGKAMFVFMAPDQGALQKKSDGPLCIFD